LYQFVNTKKKKKFEIKYFLLDAAYKMLGGNSPDQKANLRDQQSRLTRPDLQGVSDVHSILAEEHHLKKPHETTNPTTDTKKH